MAKDLRGVEIRVGDILWHPKRVGSAMWLDAKRVVAVDEKGVKTIVEGAKGGGRYLNYPQDCVVDLHSRNNPFPPPEAASA